MSADPQSFMFGMTYDEFIAMAARMYLQDVLREAGGVVAKAAVLAGRNRTDFYKLLRTQNIAYNKRPLKRGQWDRPLPE